MPRNSPYTITINANKLGVDWQIDTPDDVIGPDSLTLIDLFDTLAGQLRAERFEAYGPEPEGRPYTNTQIAAMARRADRLIADFKNEVAQLAKTSQPDPPTVATVETDTVTPVPMSAKEERQAREREARRQHAVELARKQRSALGLPEKGRPWR